MTQSMCGSLWNVASITLQASLLPSAIYRCIATIIAIFS
jgi:hypothetical protein